VWGLFACEDDGSGTVTEESAGDDVSHGVVVLLPGEGTELDREEESVLGGVGADVIDGACYAGDSCNTAEAEDGSPLDVAGEAHAVDEPGVDAGAGNASVRVEEDGGDVGWLKAGILKRYANGLLAEIDGALDPEVVVRAEAGEGAQCLEREADVAELNATVGVKAIHDAGDRWSVLDALLKGFSDDGLWITIRGECRSNGHNSHRLVNLCRGEVSCLLMNESSAASDLAGMRQNP
jgi:hypothetical protein